MRARQPDGDGAPGSRREPVIFVTELNDERQLGRDAASADDAGGSEDEGGDGFDAERPERVQ